MLARHLLIDVGGNPGMLKQHDQQANRQMFCRLASAVALLAFLDMATAQFSFASRLTLILVPLATTFHEGVVVDYHRAFPNGTTLDCEQQVAVSQGVRANCTITTHDLDGNEAAEHCRLSTNSGAKSEASAFLACSFAVPGTRMQRCFYKARVSTQNKWLW